MDFKSILLALFLFVLTPGIGLSQGFTFGGNVGLVYADIVETDLPKKFDKNVHYVAQTRFHLNAHVGYQFNSSWALAAEPGYIEKGSDVDIDQPQDGNYSIKLNYLNAPVLLEWYFVDKFYLSAGPELAYLLNDDIHYRRFELSVKGGVHYKLEENIRFGASFNRSITPFEEDSIYTNENGEIVGELKRYNNYFQISVGIRK